jgi:carbamoyltransferase
MVKKEINPLYWELINEFGILTGEHIVLNTSFNVMGEPIINTPEEAIRGFFGSGIDILIIGDFIVFK